MLPIGKRTVYVYYIYMWSSFSRRSAAGIAFFIGLFLMILGTGFLLGSLENASLFTVNISFVLVLAGVLFTALAIKLKKRSTYLFFGAFFLMAGFFLFLSALGIAPLPVSQSWPLLSVFSGLALLPVGWRRYGGFHTRYFVPSCAFIILGCVLLVFSLQVVTYSFRQFILSWWPLLFVLGGITLVLSSLGSRRSE